MFREKVIHPVIVNASLQIRGICQYFEATGEFKIRLSSSTLPDTCIFPKSPVAFLILDEREIANENTYYRIESFAKLHRNSYVLCIQNVLNVKILATFSPLQLRLYPLNCYFNVAENSESAAKIMISISKMLSGSIGECLEQHLSKVRDHVETEETAMAIMSPLPLTKIERTLVFDSCGGLSQVATATQEQLLNSGIDTKTAENVKLFFEKDTYMYRFQ